MIEQNKSLCQPDSCDEVTDRPSSALVPQLDSCDEEELWPGNWWTPAERNGQGTHAIGFKLQDDALKALVNACRRIESQYSVPSLEVYQVFYFTTTPSEVYSHQTRTF